MVSKECKVLDLNLNTMKKEDVQFSSAYDVSIIKNTRIHGLISWFDCIFEDPTAPHLRVVLPTSPYNKDTHWKQTTFYIDLMKGNREEVKKDTPVGIEVKKGDRLKGSLACVQGKKNFRELDVKISYNLLQAVDGKERHMGVELYKVR